MLHQTGRTHIFPKARAAGIGTTMMYVVRNVFSRPGLLQDTVRGLIESGGHGLNSKLVLTVGAGQFCSGDFSGILQS